MNDLVLACIVPSLDTWECYGDTGHWWLRAVSFIWLIFTFMLFVTERLFLHRWFAQRARA